MTSLRDLERIEMLERRVLDLEHAYTTWLNVAVIHQGVPLTMAISPGFGTAVKEVSGETL